MKPRKPVVLLVDDFEDARKIYGQYLSDYGFQVRYASDGRQAVSKALKLLPQIILMDLSLPKMNGWEATRLIKANSRSKHIPIIIITAYGIKGSEIVINEGCDGFLMKPCMPDDVVKEVVRVLNRNPKNGSSRLAS